MKNIVTMILEIFMLCLVIYSFWTENTNELILSAMGFLYVTRKY